MPVPPARRVRRYAVRLGLGAAVVLSSAACAGSSASPEETAQGFLRSLGAKDTEAACSVVAFDGKPLAGNDVALCRTGFDTLVNDVFSPEDLARLRDATVTGVVVQGDTATIPEGQVAGEFTAYLGEIALVRVDNRWYVNTLP